MGRILIGLLFIGTLVIGGCVNVENGGEECPFGYSATYDFTGAEFRFTGCEKLPSDNGKDCSSNADCEHFCFTNNEDLEKLGCERFNCQDSIDCPDISGLCGPRGQRPLIYIYEEGKVGGRCDE